MSNPRISIRSRFVLLALVGLAVVGGALFSLSHRLPPLKPLTPQEQRDKDLIGAIYNGDPARVRDLLRPGADPNARGSVSWNEQGDWNTQRHQWVWNPRRNQGGPTALMLAAFENERDPVRVLLQHGATINARDREGNTALIYACLYGNIPLACSLLAHGADVAPNRYGENPLTFAAELWDVRPAQMMLARGAPVDGRNTEGMTPLLIAARNVEPAMVRLLLDKGAAVDARDSEGDTPLLVLLGGGPVRPPSGATCQCIQISPAAQEATVRLLLMAGASVAVRDPQGRTPLLLAAAAHLTAIVDLLHHAGAKV